MIRSYEDADGWRAAPRPAAVEACRKKFRRVVADVSMEKPLALRLFRAENIVKNCCENL
jgi:hypothetical protein